MSTPEHLGGHCNVTHLDSGTLQFLIKTFDIKTLLDVGCGPGGMVELAQDYGLNAKGLDGDAEVNPDILHDFTDGPYIHEDTDLVWSVEFLEHVYEELMPHYMETFKCAKYVFCTASNDPRGHHHVNVHDMPYWFDKFSEYGFEYMPYESELIRDVVTTMNMQKGVKKQFVKLTGMLYKNLEKVE